MLSWLGVGFDGPRIALDDLDEGTRTMHSIEGKRSRSSSTLNGFA